MRTIQLHPLSFLVGIGIATLAFVAMAQSPTPITPVQYRPQAPLPVIAARDMVQIKEGTPYVVPVGKLLVITGLGTSSNLTANGSAVLRVNGVDQVSTYTAIVPGENRSMLSVPTGLSIPAASTVEALSLSTSNGRAWGYLADA